MTRSLAARTRETAREHPFLVEGLAAGVVNYTAAARYLGVDDEEAAATALRRYAEDLDRAVDDRDARVSMESGVGLVDAGGDGSGDPVLEVVGTGVVPGEGNYTALLARGAVDARGLRAVLDRLAVAGVDPVAAGVAGDALVVVVDRTDGADALRVVEDALDAVPVVDPA